jgi:large subunit ribosomal protein L30
MPKLRLTWFKSGIGYKRDQRLTIRSLGFHRLNQTVEQEDTPDVRGMLAKVKHLVRVDKEQ